VLYGTLALQLFDLIVQSPNISDLQKARIAERVAETDKVISHYLKYLNLIHRINISVVFFNFQLCCLCINSSRVSLSGSSGLLFQNLTILRS